jgi:peptidoglycan/LPS O-acetylase OafA/YrhL
MIPLRCLGRRGLSAALDVSLAPTAGNSSHGRVVSAAQLLSASMFVGFLLAFAIPFIVGLELADRIQSRASIVRLGDTSYSLYLVRGLAITIVARLFSVWPASSIG